MSTTANKETVLRFNKEFLAKGRNEVLAEIVAEGFVNHTAPAGLPNDVSGLVILMQMIHKGFSDLRIEIDQQIAENDLVSTVKRIHAIHTGEIMGKAATGKTVTFHVIDMVRLKDGKYTDHWGRNNIMEIIQQL
jgi:predicted ester cyclase